MRSKPPPADGEFFEMTVAEVDENTVRIVMACNKNRPEYSAKGIPDALLPVISKKLGRRVVSSPSAGGSSDVYRTNDATKYWERLRAAGGATYDEQSDIYTLL